MSSPTTDLSSPLRWHADVVRVTLFGPTFVQRGVEEAFQALTGVQADSFARDRASGEAKAIGVWKDGTLTVSAGVQRMDFLYGPKGTQSLEYELLSDGEAALEELCALIGSWVKSCHDPITRVAVGGRFLYPTESALAGYELLRDKLKIVKIDTARFRDFILRLNVATNSALDGLKLNRLTTWNTIFVRLALFNPAGNQQPTPDKHYCVCELDMNTDAERVEALGIERVVSVIEELRAEGVRFLAAGIE